MREGIIVSFSVSTAKIYYTVRNFSIHGFKSTIAFKEHVHVDQCEQADTTDPWGSLMCVGLAGLAEFNHGKAKVIDLKAEGTVARNMGHYRGQDDEEDTNGVSHVYTMGADNYELDLFTSLAFKSDDAPKQISQKPCWPRSHLKVFRLGGILVSQEPDKYHEPESTVELNEHPEQPMIEKVPSPFSLIKVESSKFVHLKVNDIPGHQ